MWNKKGLQLSLPPGDDDEALVWPPTPPIPGLKMMMMIYKLWSYVVRPSLLLSLSLSLSLSPVSQQLPKYLSSTNPSPHLRHKSLRFAGVLQGFLVKLGGKMGALKWWLTSLCVRLSPECNLLFI
jgi:hypothetical protein